MAIEQKNQQTMQKELRFSDVVTTHTMRRTAITTMLSLGVPEQVVRKISGHSPSGKEFYRYVLGRKHTRTRRQRKCLPCWTKLVSYIHKKRHARALTDTIGLN